MDFCLKIFSAHCLDKKQTRFCVSRIPETLKGQCQQIFDLFCLKIRPGPHGPHGQAKTVLQTFSFLLRYSRKTCASVVNDYVDTFWKLWKLLTNFKGTVRWTKLIRCFYTPNRNNLKNKKISVSKEKFGCPRSLWLSWHPIFELCDRISPWKRKISRTRFCLFTWGLDRIF